MILGCRTTIFMVVEIATTNATSEEAGKDFHAPEEIQVPEEIPTRGMFPDEMIIAAPALTKAV